jgi:hypothetical protein
MTTMIQQHPSPSPRHPRWEAIKRSFTQSNYITDFWNWLMTLLSKAAELVLFGSVLYSGYQLLPNITHAPAEVDAIIFVIQQAALDIGGMGLLKLAKRAGLSKDSFSMRVGVILVVLMILNVVLASLKQTVPMIPPGVFIGIETILLIARAIMAVLFGYAINALREEYGESTITVKDASELQQRLVELSSELAQIEQSLHEQLAPLQASIQQQAGLAEEVHWMQVALDRIGRQVSEREKRAIERPVLHALPSVAGQGNDGARIVHTGQSIPRSATEEKFDARVFVFSCLQENAACKLKEIQQLARGRQRDLSEATISRYRKQFFAQRESSVKAASESSLLEGENGDESFHHHASESFHREERKVVGE